jgi:MoxR-like ATPase
MQEKKVTVAGKSMPLDQPFFVLATQNPIEQEGTYPLPEAQLDRFMFNIWVDYPTLEEELEIVKATTSENNQQVNSVLTADQIMYFQQLIKRIHVPSGVYQYAVELVNKTRPNTSHAPDLVNIYGAWGAGPRASQYLIQGAKTHALLHGKVSPDIENVRAVALPILRHRLVPNYKAEAEGFTVDKIISQLL